MKKIGFLTMLLACVVLIVVSCKKDKDENENTTNLLSENYFSIEDATYVSGEFPASTAGYSLDGVSMNQNVLAGGSTFITIESEEAYEAFYVGVDGIDGYYKVVPTSAKNTGEVIIYNFIIYVSQNLNGGFDILLSGLTPGGEVTGVYQTTVNYIQAGTGALQVSLSFDQPKDVDLYVVQPDSTVVYYGNEGYWDYDEETGEYMQIWGLDVDSNASCSIDNINNENVFYPAEYVQPGKYEVWVNMYSNCSPRDYATNWVVTTLYQGVLITPSYGMNPTAGTYPADEPSNTIGSSLEGATKVMEFTISGAKGQVIQTGSPMPVSESAKMKLEMVK